MTEGLRFNLIDEPWIDVLDVNGNKSTVSIREALSASGQIRRIAGELPTQDVAIVRLLLAILYRALPVDGDDEVVRETWAHWWKDHAFPSEVVSEYLDEYRGRFELFDPATPFFQVADLRTASGKTSGIGSLVADFPAGHKFFTNRAGAGAIALSPAEAARWLVHCQAFDPSGIKSGAVGDDRVKGGKGYPIGVGWTGNLGVVVLEGANLAETLLLNLVLTRRSPDNDMPPWETDDWTASTDGREVPRGPAEALTWQIRRVRLFVDDGRVTDSLVSNGDKVRVRNQHGVEPMSGWRRSEVQEKKHGESQVYMPRTHDPDRAVWRGIEALIASESVTQGSRSGTTSLTTENLTWLAELRLNGHLDPDCPVTVHTVGAKYGTQNAFIETVINDRLVLRAEVLASRDLQRAAARAARVAATAAGHVGRLADNLARAAGRDAASDGLKATEFAYQRLDPIYRAWVWDLSSSDLRDHEAAWRSSARDAVLALGDDMYAVASPTAIRGRVVTDRNGRQTRVDAAQAHRWFTHQIWVDIPNEIDDESSPQEESA